MGFSENFCLAAIFHKLSSFILRSAIFVLVSFSVLLCCAVICCSVLLSCRLLLGKFST